MKRSANGKKIRLGLGIGHDVDVRPMIEEDFRTAQFAFLHCPDKGGDFSVADVNLSGLEALLKQVFEDGISLGIDGGPDRIRSHCIRDFRRLVGQQLDDFEVSALHSKRKVGARVGLAAFGQQEIHDACPTIVYRMI